MNGVEFMARVVATGRIHGLGIGARLDDADRALSVDCIDVIDEEYGTLRRDYGFVELYFSGAPGEWTMTGGAVELHRLMGDTHGMAEEWARHTGWSSPAPVRGRRCGKSSDPFRSRPGSNSSARAATWNTGPLGPRSPSWSSMIRRRAARAVLDTGTCGV